MGMTGCHSLCQPEGEGEELQLRQMAVTSKDKCRSSITEKMTLKNGATHTAR